MKYETGASGEVCGKPLVAAASTSAGAPPGYNCSRLLRSGEPMANAACGAVIAPWYFEFHHVALKRSPGNASGSISMPTEYVSPSCATRSLLPPARNTPGTLDVLMRHVGVAAVQPGRPIAPGYVFGIAKFAFTPEAVAPSKPPNDDSAVMPAALPRLVSAGAVNDS